MQEGKKMTQDRIYSIMEIQEMVTPIAEEYGVKSVILFGSYAKNEATADSDLDFLINKGLLCKYQDYVAFLKKLEEVFGKSVDLVTTSSLKSCSVRFQKNVYEEGVVLYER